MGVFQPVTQVEGMAPLALLRIGRVGLFGGLDIDDEWVIVAVFF